jgi:hypothetical protein
MVCERCGSISIRRGRSTPFERFLRIFTGRKRFFCKRCGWTALRAWDETLIELRHQPGGVEGQKKKADLKLVETPLEANRPH